LQAEDTQLIIGLGEAGTGKTTLALAYAFAQYQTNNKKIILVKSTAMVSNNHAFGPVPGDIGEKYAPYLTSFDIVIDKLLSGKNSKSYLAQMKERKDLEFIPVELVRGCTFEDCTVIVDEAQNLSWHEMKTLITRLGERSKMIILGDPNQIDVGVPYTNTGLHRLVNSNIFGESELTASIVLEVQYRSPIVSLIARIDKE
jgi:phosphate starvation-inducible PhoH-like protein